MGDMATAIRDGEFVQSVYDTINTNEGEFWHLPLYGKNKLFARAAALNMAPGSYNIDDVDAAGIGSYAASYSIKRYIYCTVQGFSFWKPSVPWIGYIAESSQEESQRLGCRDIVVAIRGTMGTTEWIKDLSFAMTTFTCVQQPASGAKVHAGFWSIYTSTRPTLTFGAKSMQDQIREDLLQRLAAGAEDNSTLPVRISIAGHSLGAALATLVACDVGCNVAARFVNVTVSAITFGSPKVGNDAFKRNAEKHTASIWRYRSIGDIVPSMPPSWPYSYVHVGTELILDWAPSPYVSISRWRPFGFMSTHSLELHMHVMAAESGAAVYSATQLEELLAVFSLAPHGSTYVIEDLCRMSAWDGQDGERLREDLEDAKNRLSEDQPAMEAYLREIYYIALTRSTPPACKEEEEEAIPGAVHDAASPFDTRDCSLLNKSGDILKAKYGVPEEWLIHPNKDMVWDPASLKWLTRANRGPNDIPSPGNTEYN